MTDVLTRHTAGAQTETITLKRLQQLFDDLIRALHARHSHACECVIGCDHCYIVAEKARVARETYEAGLHEYIG